jgi:hypothetical protein
LSYVGDYAAERGPPESMISSNLVDCTTSKSFGLVRMRALRSGKNIGCLLLATRIHPFFDIARPFPSHFFHCIIDLWKVRRW